MESEGRPEDQEVDAPNDLHIAQRYGLVIIVSIALVIIVLALIGRSL